MLKNIASNKQNLWWLIVALPPIFLAYFVLTRSVNVPFWDQWEIVPIIKNIREGHFYWNDFWQQHNEHRLLFPRIVMIGAAIFTKWNVRVEVLINLILAVASFGVLLGVLNKTTYGLKQKMPVLLAFILSLIWFSPVQWENWLWGWQIQWFLSVLGITMVLYALADAVQNRLSWLKVGYLVSGAIIAQFSLGNGMLIWPLAIIILLYVRTEIRKTLVVGAGALALTFANYFNYASPPNTPSRFEALTQPIAFAKYILVYMGRPFTSVPKVTAVFGILILGLFFGMCLWLFVYHKKRFKILLPWIALGLYAIGSGVITASSRLNLGPAQAYSSRYTTISSLLVVSVLVIVFVNLDEIKQLMPRLYKPLVAVSLAGLSVAVVVNASWGIGRMNTQRQYLSDIQGCTKAQEPYEVCLLSAYPNKFIVRERINYLKQIHWGGY